MTESESLHHNTPQSQSNDVRTLSGVGAPMWHEQDAKLREMWLAGVETKEISAKLGRSFSAIMTRAARLGLPRRNRPGRHRKDGAKHDQGMGATTGRPYRARRSSDQSDSSLDSARAAEVSNGLLVVGTRRTRLNAYQAPEHTTTPEGFESIRAVRICLMCLNKFHSQGRHNRICRNCKSSSEYALAGSLADVNVHASGR